MKLIIYQYNNKYIKEVGNHIGYILVDKIEDATLFSEDRPLKITIPDRAIKKIEFELKKYNSRDEFINDDGITDEEKIEIAEAVFEAERGE